jgi:hypothetical protein
MPDSQYYIFFFTLLPTFGRLRDDFISSHFVSPWRLTLHGTTTLDHSIPAPMCHVPAEPPLQECLGSRDELKPAS